MRDECSSKAQKGMSMARFLAACAVAGILVVGGSHRSAAQSNMQFGTGQNIQPVYEGWSKNDAGTFNMYFGYLNRNYVETPDIAIGPNNSFDPGPPDRGQPTHFYQRRNQFVFSVKVPADWGNKDLTWSVTHNGKTDKAIGSLTLVWEVDDAMMVKNINGQDDLVGVEKDKRPELTIKASANSTTVGEPITLTATVTDDGVPPPPKPSVGNANPRRRRSTMNNAPQYPPAPKFLSQGLSVGWLHYRGSGKVTFTPESFVAVQNGQASTSTAVFSQPGTYVLRGIGSDSWLFTTQDVTVVVTDTRTSR